ncbi:Hpt domain-containing protein [Methylophaga sulfidovorans]|uniref:Chemotaxis protein CheA n=1 Tax=Methylophaga sulfidovorans TaxID=45496 RepID=A0A1I3Y3V7_9GAMM|nr:Hpt domain-containing protein [Methylophaga sulfidovorans]SFK26627.1 chemosensory pili system protein ChpA (sensor histidine kinase/response regulator) [Methylophaga sulfidovorans]
MAQLIKGNYDALVWLQDELQQSLAHALAAMNNFLDGQADDKLLTDTIESLYQVKGTLDMINMSGAAMLTEETQKAVRALQNNQVTDISAAQDAIVKSLLLLPNYLKLLNNDFRDHPLALLELINELRKAYKAETKTEMEMFNPSFSVVLPDSIAPNPTRKIPALKIEQHKLGHVFQVLLLQWLRKQDEDSLRQMHAIVHFLRLSSHQEKVCLFWWTTEAFIEAIEHQGLTSAGQIKPLMGKLVQPIKQHSESGEAALQLNFPEELEKQLLLAIARASSRGPNVTLLKATLQLYFFDQRSRIYGMSDNALGDAHLALLEQLQDIKDQLDQHVHDNDITAETIESTTKQLQSMSDTLALLAEYEASNLLHHQVEQLNAITNRGDLPEDDDLTLLADSLLQAESLLQSTTQANVNDQLRQSVMSECLLELANIKETLTLMEKSERYVDGLGDTEQQLILIAGSLDMLNQGTAAEIIQLTSDTLSEYNVGNKEFSAAKLQELADIIACCELYMEGIRHHGHADDEYLLTAKTKLHEFDDVSESPVEPEFTVETEITPQETAADPTEEAVELIMLDAEPALSFTDDETPLSLLEEEPSNPVSDETTHSNLPSADLWQFAGGIDREVAEIFIEEATEVLQELARQIPAWINENDQIALAETRRHFHTLKGSGRMANATVIAELCWAVEDVLNHVIEGSRDDNHLVKKLVQESYQLLPELLARFTQADISTPDNINALYELKETCLNPLLKEAKAQSEQDRLTSVERYIQIRKARDDARLDIVLAAYQTQQDAQKFPAKPLFEIDANIPTSVERYIRNKWGTEQNLSNTATSVEKYIQRLASKQQSPEKPQQTGVERYISQQNRLKEIDAFRSEQSTLTTQTSLSSVDHYIIELGQKNTGVSEYIKAKTLSEVEADEIVDEEDNELLSIFVAEAKQHIANLKQSLNDIAFSRQITSPVLRSVHSLKGCANIAGIKAMAMIATEMDQAVKQLHMNDVVLDNHQMKLMNHVVEGFDQVLHHITGEGQQPDLIELSSYISELMPSGESVHAPVIDPEFLMTLLEETDELLEDYTKQLKQWQQVPSDQENITAITATLSQLEQTASDAQQRLIANTYASLSKLINHCHPQDMGLNALLEQGYEQLNQFIESLLQNKPLSTSSDFPARVDSYLTQKAQHQNGIDIDETDYALPTDVDDDLLSAFAAEAQELLDSSRQIIKAWVSNTHTEQDTLQLQRDLHTLKGGARLTGITPMADLTHQIETLVLAVSDGLQEADEDFFDLLQRCQDKLAEMQEQLANQQAVKTALSLIAEITARTQGQDLHIEDRPLPAPEKVKQADHADSSADILPVTPPQTDHPVTPQHVEQVRVRADLLDYLTNFAGEVSISRDRVTQQHIALRQQLHEMEETVSRLHDQLRNLEIETETQILFRYEDERIKNESDFDPLELDRFSMIQQLSRGLTESVIDLHDISHSMDTLVRETDAILLQQSRLNTDLQQGLMTTRLLPFSGIVGRLERIVRQTASELSKKVELKIRGSELDIDRTILDRLVAPLEHILRNAIAHGIEYSDERTNNGKSANGLLSLVITREGSEIVINISDDGQGINLDKVREKALSMNLISHDDMPTDDELTQLILSSGFSTADNVSQLAGRGVGMDVVSNEIRGMKGRLSIKSEQGKGSTFTIRLPLTLSVIQALLIRVQDEQYALPLNTINAGERISVRDIKLMLGTHKPHYDFHGEKYRFMPLSSLLGKPLSLSDNLKYQMPLLLFRSGDLRIALLVDDIVSNREIVIKSVGTQLGHISAINGATILGDGRVVFILDIPTLMDSSQHISLDTDDAINLERELEQLQDRLPTAMVVDDSITMRKATGNLLRRIGFEVMTARDGVDALSQLHEQKPDIILLDVEMPRMDGFEFASIVRNDKEFRHLPIIMITSRTGNKHRERALEIGVNAYLGKPYQEEELIWQMQKLLGNTNFQEPTQ